MVAPVVIEFKNLIGKIEGTTVSMVNQDEKPRAFSASNARCEATIRNQKEISDYAKASAKLMATMIAH